MANELPHACKECGNLWSDVGDFRSEVCPACGEPLPQETHSPYPSDDAAISAALDILREKANDIIADGWREVGPEWEALIDKLSGMAEDAINREDKIALTKVTFVSSVLAARLASLVIVLTRDPGSLQLVIQQAMDLASENFNEKDEDA